MAVKVTVLKVCIVCNKCMAKLLKAVGGLEGVTKIEADEEKSTLTVVGVADPHTIIACARKVSPAEIISISDPKKPEKPKDEKPVVTCCSKPCSCRSCYLKYVIVPYDLPAGPCSYPDQPTCTIM